MPIERLPSRSGAYSAAVSVEGPGRWVYVSGALGTDRAGELVEGGTYGQALAAFAQIRQLLHETGATLRDVVRITTYLTDLSAYADFSRARAETFREELPASVAVGVDALLFGAAVEVDAVAFTRAAQPDDGRAR